MPPYTFTASILSADLGNLQAEVDAVASADAIQIDVMDGHFVPNLSFGVPVVKSITTTLPLDIHLMVANPEERIEEFLEAGAASITFHAETIDEVDIGLALIAAIKDGGANAAMAMNPETEVSVIEQLLPELDMLTVMSVHPGFGGQAFLPEVLSKVVHVRSMYPELDIQMDGGVSIQTLPQCIEAGATNFVVGSALFSAPDQAAYIAECRSLYA